MNAPIQTREFVIDDYEAALDLWKRVEGLEISEGDDKPSIAQFLKYNPGLSRVAIGGSKLVGVALCGHDGRRGHIYHLAIDPAFEGQGLARKLVRECLDRLRNIGLPRAIILVAGDNLRGQAFWKRCGWEEVDGALAMGIDIFLEG